VFNIDQEMGGGELRMLQFYFKVLDALRTDEDGQAMVEYALILVLVSVVALFALGVIGTNVNNIFNSIGAAL
jgi:Flp pilus assembly pilin Flp